LATNGIGIQTDETTLSIILAEVGLEFAFVGYWPILE